MASMKSWFEKIKDRITKKVSDENLLKSKIQSKKNEDENKNKMPDLITPTSEDIKEATRERQNTKGNEIQREEAIKVKPRNDKEEKVNKKMSHLTDVPDGTLMGYADGQNGGTRIPRN